MSLPSLRHPSPRQTVIHSMTAHPMPPTMSQPSGISREQPSATLQYWPSSSTSTAHFLPTPTKTVQDERARSATPTMGSESKKTCDISNLMSPPEPAPLESFMQVEMAATPEPAPLEKRPVPNPPLSPPVSPPNKAVNPVSSAVPAAISIQDPIIFPSAGPPANPPVGPLFIATGGSIEAVNAATRQLVDEHIASRPASLFREATPPRREDYELALYFKSNCLRMFKENPKAYLRQERELLRADRKSIIVARPIVKLPPILPASRPTASKPQTAKTVANRIQKPRSPRSNGKVSLPRPIRATPAIRQTIRVSSTPEPRVRTVAPNREDKDFRSLPDYCPPLNSLPNKPNSLKVDWKGNALDLSKDPHASLLHPDELLLAAGLRLDCATYLTSKRRMFMRRVECAKIGKEFRKTDAQQACKIDVNKASKLWTAYEKVGWLDGKWVHKYLN